MAIDYTNIDKDALRLTKAIRQVESGGNPNAVGDKGYSKGAYQWQPGNYEAMAKQYGIDPTDRSLKTQNKVAYSQVKEWKDKGYSADQIAAAWNMGSSTLGNDKWKTNKGYNKAQGYEYDTPAHVARVKSEYLKLKEAEGFASTQNITQDNIPTTPEDTDNLGEKAYKFIVGGITDPAATLYGGARNLITGEDNATVRNVLTGENTQALGYDEQGNKLSTGQTIAQGAGAAAQLIPTTKLLGMASKGAKIAKLGVNPITSQVGKSMASNALLGGMYAGGESLRSIDQEDSALQTGMETAGAAGIGMLGGSVLGAGTAMLGKGINKLTGAETPSQIMEKIRGLDREGKFAEADALRNDKATKALYESQGIKTDEASINKQLAKDVQGVKDTLDDGIARSSESAALKKTLKLEKYNDDDIVKFLENVVPGKSADESIFAGTVAHIDDRANELFEQSVTPLLSKLDATGIKLANVNPNNLINLVEKNLKDQRLTAEVTDGLTNAFRRTVNAEVQAARDAGREFDISDMYKILRSENAAWEKISTKGELGRAAGDTLRTLIDNAAKTAKNPQAREVISHLRAVDKEYSKLMRAKDIAKLMASMPGQRVSVWLNRLGGMGGFSAGGPLGYPAGSALTEGMQKYVLMKHAQRAVGGSAAKLKNIDTDTLIGSSKKIMDKIDNIATERNTKRSGDKLMKSLAEKEKASREAYRTKKLDAVNKLQDTLERNKRPLLGTGEKQAISNTPIVVNPTAEVDVAKGFPGGTPLKTGLFSAGPIAVGATLNQDANLRAELDNNATTSVGISSVNGKPLVVPEKNNPITKAYDTEIQSAEKLVKDKLGITLPKGFIKTLLAQESNFGTNDTNYNKNLGENAWLVGLTDGAKKDLAKRLTGNYAVDKELINPDSIQGAINAAALYIALQSRKSLGQDKTGTKIIDTLAQKELLSNVDKLYKEYNGNGTKNAEKDFKKRYEYFK